MQTPAALLPTSETLPLSARDIFANVLQLCEYVEDMRVEQSMLKTYDYGVLRAKARQVRTIILERT